MSKKNHWLFDMTPERLANWLLGIVAIGVLTLGGVLLKYRLTFPNFSPTADGFGQFGDFVGGALNPIFGFLGLIALLVTVALQRKELQVARDELSKATEAQTILANNSYKAAIQELLAKLELEIIRKISDRMYFVATDGVAKDVTPTTFFLQPAQLRLEEFSRDQSEAILNPTTVPSIHDVGTDVYQVSLALDNYREIVANHQDDAIAYYYTAKFFKLATQLSELGIFDSEDHLQKIFVKRNLIDPI